MSISSIYGGSQAGCGTSAPIVSANIDMNGHLILVYANGTQANVGLVKGPSGSVGPNGLPGEKGEQGSIGPQGIPGEKGNTGEQGLQGIQGLQGYQGHQGIPGPIGPRGIQGEQGVFKVSEAVDYQEIIDDRLATEGDIWAIISWPDDISNLTDAAGAAIQRDRIYLAIKDKAEGYLPEGHVWSKPFPFTGAQGIPGEKGNTGEQGLQGLQGIQGIPGEKGDSIENAIVDNNGILTVTMSHGTEFKSNIMGVREAIVHDGVLSITRTDGKVIKAGIVVGPVGPTGNDGPIGKQGNTGTQGQRGERGLIGPEGRQGNQGARGEQGLQGIRGERFTIDAQGDGIPVAQPSTPDQYAYLDNSTGRLWIYNISTSLWHDYAWRGEQGIQGEQGLQGIQGEVGLTGPQGKIGTQGIPGIQGLQGIQGEVGPHGKSGTPDAVGIAAERNSEPYSSEKVGFRYYGIDDNILYVKQSEVSSIWTAYDYTQSVGPQGEQGEQGIPFTINEIINSSEQGIIDGNSFVDKLIDFTVFDETTGMLFIKTNDAIIPSTWRSITFRGPAGPQGDALTFVDLTPEQQLLLKGEQGLTGPQGDIPTMVGEWNEGSTYVQGNLVSENNAVYQAINDVSANIRPSSNTAMWRFVMTRLPPMPADAASVDYVIGERNGVPLWITLDAIRDLTQIVDSHRRFNVDVRSSVKAVFTSNTAISALPIAKGNDWILIAGTKLTEIDLTWAVTERSRPDDTITSMAITDPMGATYNLTKSDITQGHYTLSGDWHNVVGSNGVVFTISVISKYDSTPQTFEQRVIFVDNAAGNLRFVTGFNDVDTMSTIEWNKLKLQIIKCTKLPADVVIERGADDIGKSQYAWIGIMKSVDNNDPWAFTYDNLPLLRQVQEVEVNNVTYLMYRSANKTGAPSLTVTPTTNK